MDMWGRSLLVSVGLLVVLLPGCSAGRRSVQHREIREEVHSIHSDDMPLLKNLYQASRNKVIDIEHIVFDSCRLNISAVSLLMYVGTGRKLVESVVSSGSVDESCFASSDSFQKGSTVGFFLSEADVGNWGQCCWFVHYI